MARNREMLVARLSAVTKRELRKDWFRLDFTPATSLKSAGVYQWSVDGVGVYVGQAEKLHRRLRDYRGNLRAMLSGDPYHGDPTKEYRVVHHALHEAYGAQTVVTFRILELCSPDALNERERHWLNVRQKQAEQGGPTVLNKDSKKRAAPSDKGRKGGSPRG